MNLAISSSATAQQRNSAISGIPLAVPKSPAAVVCTPQIWKYNPESFRGYLQGDDRVGQWSDVVSIPVAG